jgi:hypothetical protein
MARTLVLFLAAPALLNTTGVARAQDEPRAILVRAVQAQGGEATLARFPARHIRVRGTLSGDRSVPFTHELYHQVPGRLRDVLTIEVDGKKTTVVYSLSGEDGWMQADGKQRALPAPLLAELKESAHLAGLSGLHGVLAAETQAAKLPAAQIAERPALGVRLSVKGHRDVDLYFDKETALLVKAEHAVLDSPTGKMVKEERFYSKWKEVKGLKLPTHVAILRDAKKFLEAEATDVEVLERIDDKLFTTP